MSLRVRYLFLTLLLCSISSLYAVDWVSPLDYGLKDAKSGQERYDCLLRCHKDAVSKNAPVYYGEIDSIMLELPKNFQSIPLTDYTDFANCAIHVVNNSKSEYLFTMYNNVAGISVPAQAIDYGYLRNVEQLKNGNFLLIIKDKNIWVDNRTGYNYGHTRRDVLFIAKGIAFNSPISSYCNHSSIPECQYCEVTLNEKVFKNLRFSRDASSAEKTFLVKVCNNYNISIKNIRAFTPSGTGLIDDKMIEFQNCANVRFVDVYVDGSYSLSNKSGYAFSMNNVTNFRAERVVASAPWGVFGGNNVNNTVLVDCEINRYDIHCYGRNVRAIRCKFSDLYNQYSSVFGKIDYIDCRFVNCTPVLIESSYNAYTPFDLSFKNCVFDLTSRRNYLITLLGLEDAHNSRAELYRKALPNIKIKNCTVNLADNIKDWYLVNTGKVAYKETLDYISKIEVNRLKINGNVDYKLFSTDLKTTNPLNVVRKKVIMNK